MAWPAAGHRGCQVHQKNVSSSMPPLLSCNRESQTTSCEPHFFQTPGSLLDFPGFWRRDRLLPPQSFSFLVGTRGSSAEQAHERYGSAPTTGKKLAKCSCSWSNFCLNPLSDIPCSTCRLCFVAPHPSACPRSSSWPPD
jgi:hypothetical protein